MSEEEKKEAQRQRKLKNQRAYHERHRDEIVAKKRKHREENREKINEQNREWEKKNPERVIAKRKRHYEKHKERELERARKWQADNRERHLEVRKKYRKENPEKVALADRRQKLKKYGLTPEQYDAMAESQDGVCAICGFPNEHSGGKKSLAVDHDHKTGAIRQLLCDSCNGGLGLFKDSIRGLEAAIEYLKKHGG